ncbi:hypothetical protein BD309DRAFT_1023938 [Dichomitus squalens]|nr:hypothetical protein BD309DRAFT_1023938 [Dichomitus squalens]
MPLLHPHTKSAEVDPMVTCDTQQFPSSSGSTTRALMKLSTHRKFVFTLQSDVYLCYNPLVNPDDLEK